MEKNDSHGDDIEAEANSYFHQLFSDQLSIDAMIQVLSRFKESSDKREQSILDCMIDNLFDEYKFFSKYPEPQLTMVAIIFGSLIKHEIVTRVSLGIALRAVLDALKMPSDSKMFSFGAKALEQFVERLVEWPHYTSHVLQISHLRALRSDLVASIENRVPLNGINSPSVVHNNVTYYHHHAPVSVPVPVPVQVQVQSYAAANVEFPVSSFSRIGPQVHPPSQIPQRPISPTSACGGTLGFEHSVSK